MGKTLLAMTFAIGAAAVPAPAQTTQPYEQLKKEYDDLKKYTDRLEEKLKERRGHTFEFELPRVIPQPLPDMRVEPFHDFGPLPRFRFVPKSPSTRPSPGVVVPLPRTVPPPGAMPFRFNGSEFYVIPLRDPTRSGG